jgi:hypothetical protein
MDSPNRRSLLTAEPPPPLQTDAVRDRLGAVPLDMVFKLTEQAPTQSAGGNVRIADPRNFPISTDVDVDEPFHRKHRQRTLALSRAVQVAVLHGCFAGAMMDGADTAGARRSPSQDRPRGS